MVYRPSPTDIPTLFILFFGYKDSLGFLCPQTSSVSLNITTRQSYCCDANIRLTTLRFLLRLLSNAGIASLRSRFKKSYNP